MRFIIPFVFLTLSAIADVTPAQWLASRPKPQFAPGHHLQKLTKYGWPLPWELTVETATNWGFTLDTISNDDLFGAGVTNALNNSTSILAKAVALATNYPSAFSLSFNLDRTSPTNLSNGFWVTNAAGLFVDINSNTWQFRTNLNYTLVVSPEATLADLNIEADAVLQPMSAIKSVVSVGTVLNGGERGLGLPTYDSQAWQFDPRVIANRGSDSWAKYASRHKARHLGVLLGKIQSIVPTANYVFYNTGNEESRDISFGRGPGGQDDANSWWNVNDTQVGWWSSYLFASNAVTQPSFQVYYSTIDCLTNRGTAGNGYVNDVLTVYLNAVGYNISIGLSTNYTWASGGWSTTDTNRLCDISRYTGLLKCLYVAGSVGVNAGYYDVPVSPTNSYLLGGPGFDASFPSNQPPHWLQQVEVAAQVHAEFSWLENYILAGSLLVGNGQHYMATNQPAYEFTNTVADTTCRVMARKLNSSDNWLVCAWKSAGTNRTVTVNIPTLGSVAVNATDSGSIYTGTTNGLTLWDWPSSSVQMFTATTVYTQ